MASRATSVLGGRAIDTMSRRAGVTAPMIRFYETRGLVPDPGWTEGGQRR